jgi:hypothetical protein
MMIIENIPLTALPFLSFRRSYCSLWQHNFNLDLFYPFLKQIACLFSKEILSRT